MAKTRVAVIGAGISGLVAATVLTKGGAEVVLYEKEDYLGGHAKTVTHEDVDLDLGFLFFNRVTYPNLMEFFESLGVEVEEVEMSFSVSLDRGQDYEWGNRNGISSLFAQKKNVLNPNFWQMIREIVRFKNDALMYLENLENNPVINRDETLGHFIKLRGYSDVFQKAYLFPICASVWSCPVEGVMNFSAYSVLSLCRSRHLLQLFRHPQWHTLRRGSQNYVDKVREQLESRGCQIRSHSKVLSVSRDKGCLITCQDGSKEPYDVCIIATNTPDTLRILGEQATCDETRVLGSFQYVYSNIFLHRDKNFMPQNLAAWSARNFLKIGDDKFCLTYWLNVLQDMSFSRIENVHLFHDLLQNTHDTEQPYLITINPPHNPKHILLKWSTGHPIPSIAASKASIELNHIQGKRGIWFCGEYQGYGFLEDGVKASLIVANSILTKSNIVLSNPKHMLPSLMEKRARACVIKLLGRCISTGSLILLEEGGSTFNFEGTEKNCLLKVSLRIHNPQFYWKIATHGDLGLADAYIHGDFSLVDKNDGLQNLFMIFIANRELKSSVSTKRSYLCFRVKWTLLLSTACMGSAINFLRCVSRQNTLTLDRRNISRHYDLSNEIFALFLDETLTYSCAIFKFEDEDLKVAQMRKFSLLIEKARINEEHEILEIGSGWGSLAIEVVKRTRCNYTGITLSKEQLRFAEMKVREAGLQDRIKFFLCHCNQLPDTYKYDRIISCEMIEHVGHEHMEEFFGRCDSVLANDGLLVLQFTSIPDERYDEYRRSTDFIKEYIFPGGCLPSLSRTTSAMATSSRLCIEQVENIGLHYIKTLGCWKENFLKNRSEIISLGFNEKFIQTWVYYFDYCIAGFKTCTLRNYQMVLSRPGNVSVLGDPFKGLPSAY